MTYKTTFYPKPEFFESATGISSKRHKITCPDCRRGVLFSVESPRIRWGMGQQTYRCERCHSEHVVQYEEC